jgi:WD40 repeat protein
MRGRPSKLGEISCLAWSPDGKKLLTGGTGNYVRLWSMPDGTLQGLIPIITAKDLAFSADGTSLSVFQSLPENGLRHELRIYRTEDLSLLRSIGNLKEPHALLSDGTRMAVIPEGGNRIELLDPHEEQAVRTWDPGFPIRQLAFSTDGTMLYGTEQSGILIMDPTERSTSQCVQTARSRRLHHRSHI